VGTQFGDKVPNVLVVKDEMIAQYVTIITHHFIDKEFNSIILNLWAVFY